MTARASMRWSPSGEVASSDLSSDHPVTMVLVRMSTPAVIAFSTSLRA
jgi:hypothetical protein